MTRKKSPPAAPLSSPMAAGPWGGDDKGDGEGSENAPPKGSPWLPGSGAGNDRDGQRPRRIDDLLRRNPFGPGLPTMPGGRRLWLWGALGVVLLWVAFTSIHILEPEEDGVITRLGSYSRTVGPGVSL
ncbi:MAG: protease modulator HflK, partial [Sphingopyxis sp.]